MQYLKGFLNDFNILIKSLHVILQYTLIPTGGGSIGEALRI